MIDPAPTEGDDRVGAERAPAKSDGACAGPGSLLADERRRQGLSLGDIARQLKLSVRQIEAIERDDYGVFPGMVFVRGFLRNYAKLLQLEAEALIAQLPGTTSPSAPAAIAPSVPVPLESGRGWRPGLGWVAGAAVLAVLVLAAIYEGRRHQSGTPTSGTAQPAPGSPANPQHPDSPPAGLAAPAPADLAQSSTAAMPAGTTSAQPVPASSLPSAPPSGGISDAAPPVNPGPAQLPAAIPAAPPPAKQPEALGTPAGPVVAARPTAAAVPAQPEAGQLRLKFQGEAWVEVRDASGALIFSQLGSPGSEQVVQGRAPLRVVVGNAHAVQLTYQGRSVDLAPHTRVDVARLVLE